MLCFLPDGDELRYGTVRRSFLFPLSYALYKSGPLTAFRRYFAVRRQLAQYRYMLNGSDDVRATDLDLWLVDDLQSAGNADGYFYQDTWFARKLFAARPNYHVDIGSQLISIGIISQLIPTTYVDVRKLDIHLPDLEFRQGSLEALPFETESIESISSLNVIEHCGLGRYGDPLDPLGSDKACAEISRVSKSGGSIYVAVPTEKKTRTCFNANRIFNPDDLLSKFSGIKLIEEAYTTVHGMANRKQYEQLGMPYSYGCFHLRKR